MDFYCDQCIQHQQRNDCQNRHQFVSFLGLSAKFRTHQCFSHQSPVPSLIFFPSFLSSQWNQIQRMPSKCPTTELLPRVQYLFFKTKIQFIFLSPTLLRNVKITQIYSLEAISIIEEKILSLHVFQKQLRVITSQNDLVPKDDLVQSLQQIQRHLDNSAET